MLSFSQRVLGVLTFVIVLLGLAGIGGKLVFTQYPYGY